ncbi:MAG: hypothetical protein AAFY57_20695, partial [Cyanobacteria bacterium J06642_2]
NEEDTVVVEADQFVACKLRLTDVVVDDDVDDDDDDVELIPGGRQSMDWCIKLILSFYIFLSKGSIQHHRRRRQHHHQQQQHHKSCRMKKIQ